MINNGIKIVDGYIPSEELRRKAQAFYLEKCRDDMRRRERLVYIMDVVFAFGMGACVAIVAWIMFGGF